MSDHGKLDSDESFMLSLAVTGTDFAEKNWLKLKLKAILLHLRSGPLEDSVSRQWSWEHPGGQDLHLDLKSEALEKAS